MAATKSKDMMATLEEVFTTKAPFQIPANGKEWIVKYGPWIELLLLILALPALLLLLGLSAFILPAAAVTSGGAAGLGVIALVLAFAALILQAMSIPGLLRRSMNGWNLAFYASVVSLVNGILGSSILYAIVGAIITWYILFQVRSYYK